MGTDRHSYEAEFAALVGAPEAVAFGFARHAIAATFRAAGLEEGDEVIVSPFTCKVVPLSILGSGLRPVFTDIDPRTFNLDADHVHAAIGERTRAILFQHTYGHPSGLAEIAEIADRADIILLEDRAQTLPHQDVVVQRGEAAVYSNNLLKPLPAGTGGLATLRDGKLAARVREERDSLPALQGISALGHGVQILFYDHFFGPRLYWPLLALKRRLSPSYSPRSLEEEIEGELRKTARRPGESLLRRGSRSLGRVEDLAAHSQGLCGRYEKALANSGVVSLPLRDPRRPLHYYPVLTAGIEEKEELVDAARRANIELITWPDRTPIYPIVDKAELSRYGYKVGSCPAAEDLARRVVCLPTHEKIDPTFEARLIRLISDFATKHSAQGACR